MIEITEVSSDRRIFTVDVGNMSEEAVAKFIKSIIEEFQTKNNG